MDCSPPGSSVYGILQARTLMRIAMLSSRGSSRPRDQTCSFSITGGFFATEAPGKPEECVCHRKEKSGEGQTSLLCFWQVTVGSWSGKGKARWRLAWRPDESNKSWDLVVRHREERRCSGHTDSVWQDWLEPYPLTLESILLTDLIRFN